jgi:hypothetical protein
MARAIWLLRWCRRRSTPRATARRSGDRDHLEIHARVTLRAFVLYAGALLAVGLLCERAYCRFLVRSVACSPFSTACPQSGRI